MNMGTIASQRFEGVVSEVLDGQVMKDGETIGILWPDQFKENHKVMIVSEIVPNGTRERAYVKINIHGIYVPVLIMHLISLGAEVSRKSVW